MFFIKCEKREKNWAQSVAALLWEPNKFVVCVEREMSYMSEELLTLSLDRWKYMAREREWNDVETPHDFVGLVEFEI